MNIRSIVVFLLLSVGALSLVQCNTAKSASASNDSPQPVMISFIYQLKDSGKWKPVIHHEYVVADKGDFIIFQEPARVNETKFIKDENGDVIDNELTEIKGYYVYHVFEKGKNNGFQFSTHTPNYIREIKYDSFLTLSTSLSFDKLLPRIQGNYKLFKREQNGDSLVILETVMQKKDKTYNDTVLTKYRKGRNNFAFEFSTILDTIKGMRFEAMELVYKGDENFDAPLESRPRKFTFSSTPAVPDKWEEFDKAINLYKERTKPSL